MFVPIEDVAHEMVEAKITPLSYYKLIDIFEIMIQQHSECEDARSSWLHNLYLYGQEAREKAVPDAERFDPTFDFASMVDE